MKKTKAEAKISKVMREYKAGTLHSGKGGPVVKKPKQAIAIALSQSRRKK
jgi:ribosomal protein L21E